jgi:hypothetical protein
VSDDECAAWLLIAAPAAVFAVLLLGDVVLPAAAWAVLVLAEWWGVA